MKWPALPLSAVCQKITDGSHRTPPFVDEGFPFVTVVHVRDDGKIDFDAASRISKADLEDLKKNDCRPLPGDVLFSKDGTVGKVSVVDFDREFAVLSSLAILRPIESQLCQRYLAYALRWPETLKQATDRKSGSAIRRIILRDLAHVRIPLPPLPEQARIVRLLDAAEALRRLRAAADRRTAELIPALFHDMFGDPSVNSKGWPAATVKAICDVKGGKRLPKGEQYSEVPTVFRYIRVSDLENGRVSEDQLVFLKPETQAQIARYTVSEGDLIISIAGTTGVVAPVTASLDGANLTENAAKLVPKVPEVYHTVFLCHLFQTEYVQQQIGAQTGQVTIGKLALFRIERLRFGLPPLPLQRQFAARVAEIRALEAQQAASRRRLDDLFQSMLHRAFRGEL
ncbi:MAG TPA: restriction endonuclease subunit S [Terriglobia bacterium]|nr:restriction endonuclease subunit S [Terriglobia bacterium]